MLNWINIELTNECNKACWFCGRAMARADKIMKVGQMPTELFDMILDQFSGDIIQFNRDGDPLMYFNLKYVGERCSPYVTNIVTNGKLLWEKRGELKDNFNTVTVSVIEDDNEQFEIVKNFIEYTEYPKVYIKFLGDYKNPEYEMLGLKTMRRSVHAPEGDIGYKQSKPPIPELGVCLDFLYKPAIDWEGNVHICNRYDPENIGVIGNIKKDTLNWIWDSPLREEWLDLHKKGMREKIPFCRSCQFWGIPANG